MIYSTICAFSMALPAFVAIPAGYYQIGKHGRLANPKRIVFSRGFQISSTEITNNQFSEFTEATKYITDAEQHQNAMVFEPGLKEFRWLQDRTASWRFPNGVARGGIENKGSHPVTCISYHDAIQYCKWAGVRLPTLVEWEIAARGGSEEDHFFGTEFHKIGLYANIWHGRDHLKADFSDGYMTTAPVATFQPNPFGLYDVYGNVFEFCSGSLPGDKSSRVVHARGGSWWCSRNSCSFFNSVDIGKCDRRASFSNQGFRIARDLPK